MLRAVASLHALRAFVMCAPDKNSRARANYSRAFLSILRAVAFCTRVFVKFKTSGTVYKDTYAHKRHKAPLIMLFYAMFMRLVKILRHLLM